MRRSLAVVLVASAVIACRSSERPQPSADEAKPVPFATAPLLAFSSPDQLIAYVRDDCLPPLRNTGDISKIRAEVVAPLIEVLNDDSASDDSRAKAANALGATGDPRAVQALIPSLRGALPHWVLPRGQLTVEALITLRPHSVAPSIAALNDPDRHVRAGAVAALVGLETKEVLQALLARLKDEDAVVRAEAARSILRTSQSASTPEWRAATVSALDSLLAILGDKNARLAGSVAASTLGAFKESRAVPVFVDALVRGDIFMGQALVDIGPPAVPTLIETLNRNLDLDVITALGRIGDPMGLQALAPLARRTDGRRGRAFEALEAGGRAAVDVLIPLLQDSDPEVRSSAARSLGVIGDQRAVPSLIESLKDDKRVSVSGEFLRYVRLTAARALGQIGDSRASAPLIVALAESWNPRDRDERKAIVIALGKLKTAEATATVAPLLTDPRAKDLLQEVVDGLARIGTPAALAALAQEESEATHKALVAATSCGRDLSSQQGRQSWSLDVLLRELDVSVHRGAISALAEKGDVAVASVLARCLANWDLREAAAVALRKLKWTPATDEDRIHLLAAEKNGTELRRQGSVTSAVLLADIRVPDSSRIENAVFTLIGLGGQEDLPRLMRTLCTDGSREMAEVFLNSSQPQLENAATYWARRNGFSVRLRPGVGPIAWGTL